MAPRTEDFLRAAAPAGVTKLPSELADIITLESALGPPTLVAALGCGLTFRRFTAAGTSSILAAGGGGGGGCSGVL